MTNTENINIYGTFAEVYDMFMDNIPYEEWCAYINELLHKYEIKDGIILDLGCGTGAMTRLLSTKGYDMIGVDCSEDMLSIAMKKEELKKNKILYLLQDMREFELYGTVRAVISICDSINYILSEEELLKVFKLVNNYLDPKGIFIFDLNTVYKYENLLMDNTIAENREEGSFIWDNYYDEEKMLNEYELTIFIKEAKEKEKENVLYRKYQEIHYQKAYTLETIIELIEKSSMEFVAVYDAYTFNEATEDSERICIIAREKGK